MDRGQEFLLVCVCLCVCVSLRSKLSSQLVFADMWPHYCHPQTPESIMFNYSWTTTQHCLLGNQSQPRVNSLIRDLTSAPPNRPLHHGTVQRLRKGISQSRGKSWGEWLFIKRCEDEREKRSHFWHPAVMEVLLGRQYMTSVKCDITRCHWHCLPTDWSWADDQKSLILFRGAGLSTTISWQDILLWHMKRTKNIILRSLHEYSRVPTPSVLL